MNMCSIIGSYDIDEVKMLASINAYRGQHSHSICVIDDGIVVHLERGMGGITDNHLTNLPKGYIIGHQQAPTTEAKDISSVHPANYKGSLLWHNGIIKANQVVKWQDTYKDTMQWDTAWLVKFLARGDYDFLSEADGTFACAYYNPYSGIEIFRNANSPMFVKDSTISSTKFDGSSSIDPGVVYHIENTQWVKTDKKFKTKEQFFWTPS